MKEMRIIAPISGYLKSLDSIPDEVFSKRLMGDGFVIETDSPFALSPIDGLAKVVYPLGHAYCIESNAGIAIMVHIGLELYKNGTRYFRKCVLQGEKVTVGQKLVEIDQEKIKQDGVKAITPIIFLESKKVICSCENHYVRAGDPIICWVKHNE